MSTTYNAAVIDHFEHPRNAGRLLNGSDVVEGVAGSIAQGVMFALSARIVAGRIDEVRYEVFGCPHCIAAGSWLTERLVGADRDDLMRWSWREVAEVMAVPPEKRGRLLILEDAVRALASAWPVCT
ncbi:MAG TPA: iron-sulfur cluster assembly scaffold protein [Steroidobacteraceae bacterium]|nr:iron-sulfur cluster assembly scaffold protein [Steroidobacteraceae bacterium]